jgi:hypothetical protein
MSETGITIGLVVAVAAAGWLIYHVVSTLSSGSESSSRADLNASGSLPGSEQIDDHLAQTKSKATIRYGNDV